MTRDKISGENVEMCDFPTPIVPHSNMSWGERKNLYPLKKCIISNLAPAWARGTTWPAASWFLDPISCLIANYRISQWVRVIAVLFIIPFMLPQIFSNAYVQGMYE